MPITAEQRKRRLKYIGSSDAAAIVGLNPWKTPHDVWGERYYAAETEEGPTPQTDFGSYHEDGTLAWFSANRGIKLKRNQFRVGENGIQAAHIDGLAAGNMVVEAKCTAHRHHYGAEGSNEVPDSVYCQVQHQMYCAGRELSEKERQELFSFVVVACMDEELTHLVYRVPWDEETVRYLNAASLELMDRVKSGEPPPDGRPSVEIFERRRRVEGKKKEGFDPYVAHPFRKIQRINKLIKNLEDQKEIHRLDLLEALGDCELAGPLDEVDFSKELTFFKQSRTTYGLSAKYADHCEHCGIGHKKSEFRVLRSRTRKESDAE